MNLSDQSLRVQPPHSSTDASTVLEVSTPVDARGLALRVLTTFAVVAALSWARDFLVPLLFGIVVVYTLNPLVTGLERIRVPRTVGTVLVMAAVIAALGLETIR